MDIQGLKNKWIALAKKMNEAGIPVPLIHDPKSGQGSVSLTLVFLSFNMWLISVVGKIAGHLGGVNTNDCLNMFLACAGLYWGRKFQQSDAGKGSMSKDDQ